MKINNEDPNNGDYENSTFANTANLDLDTSGSIKYKIIPREIYCECVIEAANITQKEYHVTLHSDPLNNELVFSDIAPEKSDLFLEKCDELLSGFDTNITDILYDKLDTLGGYKSYNRSFIRFTDEIRNNVIIIKY